MSDLPFISQSPLSWPKGIKRTQGRKNALFGQAKSGAAYAYKEPLSMSNAVKRLKTELELISKNSTVWRTTSCVLSTNIDVTLRGVPRSGAKVPDDPGACLYFKLDGHPHAMPCDKWNRVEDNIAAIAKHINAVRMMQEWGVADIKQMFVGFSALPEPEAIKTWWSVLGVSRSASITEIRSAYRDMALKHHPDKGGDSNRMAEINHAWESAQSEKMEPVAS